MWLSVVPAPHCVFCYFCIQTFPQEVLSQPFSAEKITLFSNLIFVFSSQIQNVNKNHVVWLSISNHRNKISGFSCLNMFVMFLRTCTKSVLAQAVTETRSNAVLKYKCKYE